MNIEYLKQECSDREKEANWHHYCFINNMPLIITRKRSLLGDVVWDYITMQSGDEFFFEEENFIISELDDLIKFYETIETIKNINSMAGYAKNIPNEFVDDFARDVLNTLTEAKRRYDSKKPYSLDSTTAKPLSIHIRNE